MPSMAQRDDIVRAAERIFDREGFRGTGMDRLVAGAGVSSRTLYKHLGSKDALARAALEARDARFFVAIAGEGVGAMFDALARFLAEEGARGCLFLRAFGEHGDGHAVAEVMRRHKARTRDEIARRVAAALGREDEALTEQVLVLFEGAVAAAVYRGPRAVAAAKAAAGALLREAR
jgi:AcrR family transcriptional regulator